MVEMLMEGARIPAMHDWEMTGAIERAVQDTDTAENAALKMSEAMHATAYGGKGLGRPLLATKGMINPDSAQAVANFWGEHFTAPSRMVVAGSGIDHDELLSLVEPFSGAVEGVEAQESGEYEEAPYVGGQWSTKSTDGTSHVNMVFETPGGWGDVDGAVTCTVMQAMLGGGFSFSSGGPGKGMYSRLYTGVLNNHHQISMASVHGEMYDKTGMVGVSGTCEPGYEGRLVDVLTAQLTDIAAGSFSDEELSRARNSAVSSMMTNLEKKSVVSEDIGRQMLTYGKRMPAQSFIDKIHKVTAKDVAAYAKKMYATPLTYITAPVADGAFPAYSDVQTRFK
jgi:processing peptidase subunit alpha